MNNIDIILIGVFFGSFAAITGPLITYKKKKKYLNEFKINAAAIEFELLESVRSIGLDNLQETPAGRELFSLLSKQDLLFITAESATKSKAEHKENNQLSVTHSIYSTFIIALLGALGGVLSFFIPWILFPVPDGLRWILYLFLVFGFIGGMVFSLLLSYTFVMNKPPIYLRFILAIISGLIGGWISLIVIATGLIVLCMYAVGGEPRKVSKKISKRFIAVLQPMFENA